MSGAWLREDQADLAAQKILDGAAQAFIELGVSGAGMGEVARYAGCSRGTLYRYFKNRHELHLAFVNDRAMRLVAELRVELEGIEEPAQQLLEYIVGAVQKVRRNPSMAAWFEPGESGITARMSRGSEVIDCLADAFVSNLQGEERDTPPGDMRAVIPDSAGSNQAAIAGLRRTFCTARAMYSQSCRAGSAMSCSSTRSSATRCIARSFTKATWSSWRFLK